MNSYNQNQFREEAIPFVCYNSEKQIYELNDEASEFLKLVPQPIGVITVAGLYRTGKSYLLNRMLLNKSSGFGVGPTVNPCTKGLWIWGTPIKGQTPDGDPCNILIIDSEGIGALDEDQTHDTRIFSLAILLGSCFIYNSVGSIDENAIQNLSLVVNLTKHIHVKSTGNDEIDSEDYSKYFPTFYWVIRDFSLQLIDQDGEQITSKEYLEKALCSQKGFSDEVEQKNRIRRLITTFFKERECITLVRPLVNEANLQKLDKMDLEQLRPEFFEQVMSLRKRIIQRIKPKTLCGKELNGEMFVSLARSYVGAINNGAVPNIENAWVYLCQDECIKAVNNAYETYEKCLKENLLNRLPTTNEEIKQTNKMAKEAAFDVFKKKAFGDVEEEYMKEISKKMKDRITKIKYLNEKESHNICNQFIQREFQSIERKLKVNEYPGYQEYERDVKLFYHFLLEHGPKVVNRHKIFLEAFQKMSNDGANYFIKNLSSEIDIQKNCSTEVQRKAETELKSNRDVFDKEKYQLNDKIASMEKALLELQQQQTKQEEVIKHLNQIKEEQENDLKTQIHKEKNDSNNQIVQYKRKTQELEEQQKNIERDLFLKESTFQKEKALLEHKANHFEKLVEEYSTKERSFDDNMVNSKNQMNSEIKSVSSKYESIIKNLQEQLASYTDKNNELYEEKQNMVSQLDNNLTTFESREKTLLQQYDEANAKIQKLQKEMSLQNNNENKNIDDLKQQYGQQSESLVQEKSSLEQQLKSKTEQFKSAETQYKKNEAVLQQKLVFVESQNKEVQIQLNDIKKAHESTLNCLEISSIDTSAKTDNKQLLEMKEQHMEDIKNIQEDNESKIKKLIDQLENSNKELHESELKQRLNNQQYESQIIELKQSLEEAESHKQQLHNEKKMMESHSTSHSSELQSKLGYRIQELERELEESKKRQLDESNEQNQKSEESLAQLKNFYLLEKERLENRLAEEREKRDKNYNNIVEEYEQRIRDEQTNYEEEIDTLKDDLREFEIQQQNVQAQYEHEIDLRNKNQENLEKMLNEAKSQLQNNTIQYQNQLEQQMQNVNQERNSLQQKIDTMTTEFGKKDKEILTLAQKKEQAEANLSKKEEQMDQQKNDLIQEKNCIQDNLEEMRKRYQNISDDFLENKINYEKSIALSTQQNEFFSAKVEELKRQLELSSSRYEERIKNQKQEWNLDLNEKLGKLHEEKGNLENKHEKLKNNNKSNEQNSQKQIADLEKSKAILSEKLSHFDLKHRELEDKYNNDVQSVNDQLLHSKDFSQSEIKVLEQELEKLKTVHVQTQSENHEIVTNYERDKILWEGKFQFLEQQKEQAKSDLQENLKKFETTLQHLQKARHSEKSEHEQNVSEMLLSIEKKYQVQLQDQSESHNIKISDHQDNTKKLEKELKSQQDKMYLEQHNKNTSQMFTEKKLNDFIENERKLHEEVEKLKTEKDRISYDSQIRIDSEKETQKQKVNNMEEKVKEFEKKYRTIIFDQETERIKWNLEKDHLVSQKSETSENLQKSEKKREHLLRENERLKNDTRMNKRNHGIQQHVGTSFNLNISRNLGSDRKSPISSSRMNSYKTRENYNDNSYINSSMDQGNNDDDSNHSYGKDILSGLSDNKDPVSTTGFKTFQLKMESKEQKNYTSIDSDQVAKDLEGNQENKNPMI